MEKELILCDTNVLINWFKNDQLTIDSLEKIGLQNILIPSVTVMEILQGAIDKKELEDLKKKLGKYNILHFNLSVIQYIRPGIYIKRLLLPNREFRD